MRERERDEWQGEGREMSGKGEDKEMGLRFVFMLGHEIFTYEVLIFTSGAITIAAPAIFPIGL